MHILYLHQYFCPPGGSGNNRSFELAKAWVAAGHQVTMLTSQAYFPQNALPNFSKGTARLEVEGIDVWVVNSPYAHHMTFKRRVLAFLQFYRKAMQLAFSLSGFDLVYASSTPLTVGELGRKLAQRWQIPFVFETVDVWPDVPIGMGILKNPLLIRWLHHRTRRIYRESAAIITLSEGMRDQVLSHQVPPEKVQVVHNGTHPEAIPFVTRTPGQTVTVLYAGTVGIANGLDQLLEAARYLQEKGATHIHFVVLGEGNDLERVKALAETWKLTQVEFKARVPKEEVPQLLARAEIGAVCFAPFEVLEANSANKFYDYLASGLPVVINYQGWQAQYLSDHQCGLSAPQGDIAAFARNILHLADHPELRTTMGQNGCKLAETHFDRRKLADRLMDLFTQILS